MNAADRTTEIAPAAVVPADSKPAPVPTPQRFNVGGRWAPEDQFVTTTDAKGNRKRVRLTRNLIRDKFVRRIFRRAALAHESRHYRDKIDARGRYVELEHRRRQRREGAA